MDRRNLLQAVLALGVVGVRVHRHRARSVQGNKCGDVVEVIGLERLEQRAHAVGIELEHTERVSARQQLVRLPVIERDLRVVDDALAVVLDVGERVADDRQVGQAEEVHLDQAERFARMVLERGGDGAVGALQQRRGVGDRRGTHDRGARVDSGLANQPLDALRLLGDALDFGIGVVQLAVFARLGVALGARVEDVVHADVLASGGGGRQRLGDTSAHLKGESHDARGVLERLLGLDGAVDHALGDLVMAVLVGHIAQHAHAAFGIEVDVDIGQGHTLGVQEPLEDQAVLERIELGDAHRIGDHGPCGGASPRAHHHAVLLRPVDVVGDDEEVAAELHLADDAAFIVGLLEHLHRRVAVVALLQALLDLLEEQRGLVPPFGAVELRHERAILMVVEDHVAAFRDLQRVVAGVGMVLEQLAHLLGGFDVVSRSFELEAVGVVQRGAGVDAQHGVLGVLVRLHDVVRVVGGEQGRAELLGDGQQIAGNLAFDGQSVVHQLDVEIVLAEDVLELAGGTQRLVELA